MSVKIPDFSKARVLVAGDVMLDRYWSGSASRISPEAPVPVVNVSDCVDRAGGAANVALNIASLGASVTLAGLVGDDEAASILSALLDKKGIKQLFSSQTDYKTITKLRVLSRHQQLIRLDFEDSSAQLDTDAFRDSVISHISDYDVLVLSDYNKGSLAQAQSLISAARKAGVIVLVDPKGHDFEKYRGASLLTPNLSEFESIVGYCREDDELETKAAQLRQQLDLQALLVTRSERGMTLLQDNLPSVTFPTKAREVYDVTGAGDTVIGVLAAALAAGADFESAALLSNIAAGIVVGRLGAACVNTDELKRATSDAFQLDFHQKIVSLEELKREVAFSRSNGQRVVMTNGCFDILHAGHVQYLSEAVARGDRLIVAVNDDDSVKRLKGESRPINNLHQRMEVLAALASVDWVIAFAEDTPENLICEVLPDLLVKGGDYKAEEIAGADCVINNGGTVEVLSLRDGCSTSRIIQTAQITKH
ncbi:MAG: bifunctional D-glycero-beta-D-manno-heptose-7-phosphate kinase/D-glycero-beta-D-manno-heptose 1-phosphate adenylyltransferase HldE [Gammaproteobacteria bacterium]|nr:bifunctional D-glycero-beta-D-manno-heptose-7-phosphate kinase/D-glycero-beta-D-manno-heptose 1-phosphate adenylyltransferase HldE [Gammaproteobacteria bacterium]